MINQSALVYVHIEVRPNWPACLQCESASIDDRAEAASFPGSDDQTAAPSLASDLPAAWPSIAEADLWSRTIRQRHLNGCHINDPVWGILLDIYVAESKGLPTSLSSLGYAALAPRSTSIRWVNVLIEEGKLVREPDPSDRRRSWIRLAKQTRNALDEYFSELLNSHRYRAPMQSALSKSTKSDAKKSVSVLYYLNSEALETRSI